MKDDFESLREETKNKNVEELESMKHDLIKKIEDLDKEFEVNFHSYVSDTEHKADSYKRLLEDNEKSSQMINTYQRSINRLKEQIAYWSLKMKQNERECHERNHKLRKEKEMIVKHYHDLKKKMIQFREDEERRLGNLTLNSKGCMDRLTDYQHLGEKILKTAELCRKLETEKEKVLPFYQSDPDTTGGAEEGFPEIAVERIEGLKK
jgi:DNA repair exonuclease SbcCD ATPase subunit